MKDLKVLQGQARSRSGNLQNRPAVDPAEPRADDDDYGFTVRTRMCSGPHTDQRLVLCGVTEGTDRQSTEAGSHGGFWLRPGGPVLVLMLLGVLVPCWVRFGSELWFCQWVQF